MLVSNKTVQDCIEPCSCTDAGLRQGYTPHHHGPKLGVNTMLQTSKEAANNAQTCNVPTSQRAIMKMGTANTTVHQQVLAPTAPGQACCKTDQKCCCCFRGLNSWDTL